MAPAGVPGPRPPVIVRPAALVAAARPGDVPEPAHRHLPGWVRRSHGQARPILADLLGSLDGEPRQQFESQVRQLIDAISSGKFSLAWQYPQLIDSGWALVERWRREAEVEARRRRGVESARRQLSEQLRGAGERLTPETVSRLHKNLRTAENVDTLKGVGSELEQALSSARTVEERRRDREIHRTRERLRRSLPQGANGDGEQAETWQDALRRIADQYAAR